VEPRTGLQEGENLFLLSITNKMQRYTYNNTLTMHGPKKKKKKKGVGGNPSTLSGRSVIQVHRQNKQHDLKNYANVR
jgi:hypothetical protein